MSARRAWDREPFCAVLQLPLCLRLGLECRAVMQRHSHLPDSAQHVQIQGADLCTCEVNLQEAEFQHSIVPALFCHCLQDNKCNLSKGALLL